MNGCIVSKKGNRLATRTMEDNLKKIMIHSELNLPFNVSYHTLRHSLGSHLNDEQVDVLIIQRILWHSSTRSTELYIHPSHLLGNNTEFHLHMEIPIDSGFAGREDVFFRDLICKLPFSYPLYLHSFLFWKFCSYSFYSKIIFFFD